MTYHDTSILRESDKLQFPYIPRINARSAPTTGIFKEGCMPRIDNQWLPFIVGALKVLQWADVWLGTDEEKEAAINQIIELERVLYNDDIQCGEVVYMGLPLGAILPVFRSDVLDDTWLYCDGATYSGGDYPELYAVIPDTYYMPSGNFRVPNLAMTTLVGINIPDPESSTWQTEVLLGEYVGDEFHELEISEIPSHSHKQQRWGGATGGTPRQTFSNTGTNIQTNPDQPDTLNTGGGLPHNNVQPSMGVFYYIKAKPDNPIQQTVIGNGMYALRQNPSNPCVLEQSINGGASYTTAFDFDLCFGGLKSTTSQILSSIDIENSINNYNNVQNVVNNYGGDVLNIYPDAEYGDTNDGDRDAALCFALDMVLKGLLEILVQAQERAGNDAVSGLGWGKVVVSALSTLAGAGFVAQIGIFANPLFALGLALGAVGLEMGQLVLQAKEEGKLDDIRGYDLSDFKCCLYGTMKGQTISETLFVTTFSDCLVDFPNDDIEDQVVRRALLAMATSVELFANLVQAMGAAFNASISGISLPSCDCEDSICEFYDFRDVTGGFVPNPNGEWVSGQGFRGVTISSAPLAITKDIGLTVNLNQIEFEWYSPRNDDAQWFAIDISVDGTNYTRIKYGDFRPIGFHTEVWEGNVYARYIRIYATHSAVNNTKAWIRQAGYCYQ